ncbi:MULTISPECIES: DUF6728 family protein [Olivibacter]|uniref:DUF6728 family protein n=2 Tax=Olivibacter TaxID=376469 RepID=A0ABV6HEY0_9SPHI
MYFFPKKNQENNSKKSFNLKVMHAINKIAIVLFLLGVLYKLIDWFFLN